MDKIVLTIGDRQIELTPDEAKQLRAKLNGIFGESQPVMPLMPPYPWFPPWQPENPLRWTVTSDKAITQEVYH